MDFFTSSNHPFSLINLIYFALYAIATIPCFGAFINQIRIKLGQPSNTTNDKFEDGCTASAMLLFLLVVVSFIS